ncbi:MAG: MBL fold metallo-hydrolase [Bacteroidales bacterium]|nr:MBL fold metallo-hydrolase [Bacteroidales bacterium]
MIKQFEFNHFQVNCYVVYDEATRQCAVVDPAPEASYEDAMLNQFIDKEHLSPTLVLLTHAHIDHIAGLQQICERYHLPVTMHEGGAHLLRQSELYGSVMGFAVDAVALEQLPRHYIADDERLSVGGLTIEARYVPGHCPGSLCYVLDSEKSVLTGDTLFRFSVGRSDLPGGNHQLLIDKIRSRLLTLPDDYVVLPGHGISSTIGKEKKYNEFLS